MEEYLAEVFFFLPLKAASSLLLPILSAVLLLTEDVAASFCASDIPAVCDAIRFSSIATSSLYALGAITLPLLPTQVVFFPTHFVLPVGLLPLILFLSFASLLSRFPSRLLKYSFLLFLNSLLVGSALGSSLP